MHCLTTLLPSLLLLSSVLALPSCATLVAPRAELLAAAIAQSPQQTLDEELDALLLQHVDELGNVDYAALQRQPGSLERVYAHIAALSPDSHPGLFSDDHSRLAWWLNAYNGTVLTSVTRLYPIASVEDVGTPWYLFFLPDTAGFFYLREHVFGGERHNLYDVENAIIRARHQDPRVHFALNCASAGCPRLPRRAFRREVLDQQLDRETRRFFGEPRNLAIDHQAGVIRLSQILQWYESDFLDWLTSQGVSRPRIVDYATRYAPDGVRAELLGRAADYEVEYVPYDWRLNARGLQR